ncbi:uncharacterized protein SCHCODRAFT_02130677 [Schizophyllum commune H4-8]|uniref:uncharacterized protein n=1 Tax=Schizophyllum commune (strain H4-8 / FGSC 9210) TaxID=578458 RepID=UPI00215DE42D|nr:uncharacterized protein SCHCODRAFT_02130677 [Schizophyllum commune H4-8]KAI5885067.1 hypothetical protein SCHCODRAFT_02130677 [Schizophyllum commune H4-8]
METYGKSISVVHWLILVQAVDGVHGAVCSGAMYPSFGALCTRRRRHRLARSTIPSGVVPRLKYLLPSRRSPNHSRSIVVAEPCRPAPRSALSWDECLRDGKRTWAPCAGRAR